MARALDIQLGGVSAVVGAFAAGEACERLLASHPASAAAWYLDREVFYPIALVRLGASPLSRCFGPEALPTAVGVLLAALALHHFRLRLALALLANVVFLAAIALAWEWFRAVGASTGGAALLAGAASARGVVLVALLLGASSLACGAAHLSFVHRLRAERGGSPTAGRAPPSGGDRSWRPAAAIVALGVTVAEPAAGQVRDRTASIGEGGWTFERFGEAVAIARARLTAATGSGSILMSCEGQERRLRVVLPEPTAGLGRRARVLVRATSDGGPRGFAVAEVAVERGNALTLAERGPPGRSVVLAVARLLRARPRRLDLLLSAATTTPRPESYTLVPVDDPPGDLALGGFLDACEGTRPGG